MLRSERSREAIVHALFDLVGEGTLQPTAEQVAERTGAPKDLVEAIDQATSFEAWDRLRTEQRLERPRASAMAVARPMPVEQPVRRTLRVFIEGSRMLGNAIRIGRTAPDPE